MSDNTNNQAISIDDLDDLIDRLSKLKTRTFITGAPGSGKSLLFKLLLALNIPALDLDGIGVKAEDDKGEVQWIVAKELIPSSCICLGTCTNVLSLITEPVGGSLKADFRFNKVIILLPELTVWLNVMDIRRETEPQNMPMSFWKMWDADPYASYAAVLKDASVTAQIVSAITKADVETWSVGAMPTTMGSRSNAEDVLMMINAMKTGVKTKIDAATAGSFVDPKTGRDIIVRRKKGESAKDAMQRVKRRHGFK